MKKIQVITVLLTFSVITSPILAAETSNSSPPPSKSTSSPTPEKNNSGKNNFYLSLSGGWAYLITPNAYVWSPDYPWLVSSTSFKQSGFSRGVDAGYKYALTKNFLLGVEGGYSFNGAATYTEDSLMEKTTYKITSSDWHLLLTGTYQFNNGFNIFGKAGLARVNQSLNMNNPNNPNIFPMTQSSSIDSIRLQPMIAIGTGYKIKSFEIFFQYSHIFGSGVGEFSEMFNPSNFQKATAADSYKIGISYIITI